jgi:hypothetical protein
LSRRRRFDAVLSERDLPTIDGERMLTLSSTLVLLSLGIVLVLFCRWYETRPRELGEVRLFPSTLVLAIAVLLTVVAAAHLVSLLTGVRLHGRYSP